MNLFSNQCGGIGRWCKFYGTDGSYDSFSQTSALYSGSSRKLSQPLDQRFHRSCGETSAILR